MHVCCSSCRERATVRSASVSCSFPTAWLATHAGSSCVSPAVVLDALQGQLAGLSHLQAGICLVALQQLQAFWGADSAQGLACLVPHPVEHQRIIYTWVLLLCRQQFAAKPCATPRAGQEPRQPDAKAADT